MTPVMVQKQTNSTAKAVLTPALAEKITKVLSTRFTNGFRIDSPIELIRFRHFVAEDFGKEIL